MFYAVRDVKGRIVSLNREPTPGSEGLPRTHPEVLRFLGEDEENRQFASLDAGLVRVLEDLIDALIRRNVICITDLPMEAQLKLFDRKHFREGVRDHALDLFETNAASPSRNDTRPLSTEWADSRHN